MSKIAKTPKVPYYAVIFTSIRTENDNDYNSMALKMVDMASKEPGFLGIESAREDLGITVSYWKDLKSIKIWKENSSHQIAQQKGKDIWYQNYHVRICKVEREYGV